ncbi:hypothetical protein MNV49_002316 [Pseudohyphozyma bogoriensis]|nr:hypothetical protein MNV49_002316 [Pseudohyphozyma bogoriensis]
MSADLRGEEVDASIALEFLALGRKRAFGTLATDISAPTSHRLPPPPSPNHDHPVDSSDPPFLPSPTFLYPTLASLAAAAPYKLQADAIISHSIEYVAWHHGCIVEAVFVNELKEFWSWGEERWEVVNPAWLALFFAMLCVGVSGLADGMGEGMGISEEMRSVKMKSWFDCAMACWHRLESDEVWDQSTRALPNEVRVRSLIERETKKRLLWALISQDWFSVLVKKTYIVQPTQVTTPLPLNARDEDLFTGQLISRSLEEYTVVSKTLLWLPIAQCLQAVFEHADKNPNPSYKFLLEIDAKVQGIIKGAPRWLRVDEVITLHRPFLARAFKDKRYETSLHRSISAARAILREADGCNGNRLWTVPYHLSAAATVVTLDLFQRAGSSSPSLDEERLEVLGGLRALEKMQTTSSIAHRGVNLISQLLAEEARLREERGGKKRGREGEVGGEGREYARAAKKMALSEIAPGSSASNEASSIASPRLEGSLGVGVDMNGYDPLKPKMELPRRVLDPTLFEFGMADANGGEGTAAAAALPQEFLDVFLGSGFDPLDGAITSYEGGDLFGRPAGGQRGGDLVVDQAGQVSDPFGDALGWQF